MVEIKGGDYSYAQPIAACLAADGWKFACRYASGSVEKDMSLDECVRLVEAGIWIVTVFQPTKGFLLNGYAAGKAAAEQARRIADTCGMPTGTRPYYAALDVDPNVLTPLQWDAVKFGLDGVAAVVGRDNTGLYGGKKAIDLLVGASAMWGWQTYAWSGGLWSSKAKLRQVENNITVCGGLVDRDIAVAEDYGQWDP